MLSGRRSTRRAGSLRWILSSLIGVAGMQGCASDPAEFRPAKNAQEYAPVRDAYRLPTRPLECTELGTVHADGASVLDDIATTAARHGGTHYVVHGDRTQITGYQGSGIGVGPLVTVELKPEKKRTMWALVYRCST